MLSLIDRNWMKIALKYACYAEEKGEIPIGAVLIFEKQIIGVGWNSSISQNDPTAHAEIIALRNAGKKVKNYRLVNTTLYVTLQPCMMCCGAIIHSRVKRLVFGANYKQRNKKNVLENVFFDQIKKSKIDIQENIMKNECSSILTNFFKKKRKNKIRFSK